MGIHKSFTPKFSQSVLKYISLLGITHATPQLVEFHLLMEKSDIQVTPMMCRM